MQVNKALLFVSTALLVAALLPLPYVYYMLLRIVVCGVFAYLALAAWQSGKQGLAWLLGATAAVYNPFVPLHLGRELWTFINIATVGVLGYLIVTAQPETAGDKL